MGRAGREAACEYVAGGARDGRSRADEEGREGGGEGAGIAAELACARPMLGRVGWGGESGEGFSWDEPRRGMEGLGEKRWGKRWEKR
jgi:hypothetical protein